MKIAAKGKSLVVQDDIEEDTEHMAITFIFQHATSCYHVANGTSQPSTTHHDDDLSESSVFPADSSSWVGSEWGSSELLISGPS